MNKKKTHFSIVYTACFVLIMALMLTNASLSLQYARAGLELWFDNMVPTLLPFMILSGTLIRMGLTDGFTSLVYPLITPIFRISRNACYVMVMGFMCGFPMGAKCVEDLYAQGGLNDKEAAWLLAFCNNIGPIYFVSFALPMLGCRQIGPCVFGMYGIPMLYGLFLRYTAYKGLSAKESTQNAKHKPYSMLPALNESVFASMQSIIMLGGYMILFNLLMLFPQLFLKNGAIYFAPFLEISGGLRILGNQAPVYSMILLAFGGISCIAQTYSCIEKTGLSIKQYIGHKFVLACITGIYYFLCLRFLRLW